MHSKTYHICDEHISLHPFVNTKTGTKTKKVSQMPQGYSETRKTCISAVYFTSMKNSQIGTICIVDTNFTFILHR